MNKKIYIWASILFSLLLLIVLRTQSTMFGINAHEGDFGYWSLVPPLVTLILCFTTKEVIPSLFAGIVLGGFVIGKYDIVGEFLIPSIGSVKYGQILVVYLWGLGGLIGVWGKSGGARHFAEWAGRKIAKDRRSSKFFAFLVGVLFHQGGTISTVLAGSTVKPVCDEKKVSHEELSYIIDSTASPIATIIPFNAWPIFIGSLIVGTSPLFTDLQFANTFLFQAIPFNFYAWFAITSTLLFSLDKLPWYGKKMKAAMVRVQTTGELDRPDAQPMISKELNEVDVDETYHPSLLDFFVPIGVLIGTAMIPYALFGVLYIEIAFVAAVLSAMVLAKYKGMNLNTIVEGFVNGCKGVTIGAIILGLAVTLGSVSGELGTASFVIRTTSHVIIPFLLPAMFLFITMFISFSIGTSFGTYAVVFPIAMPLAYAVNPDPFFNLLCFSAVTGGAVYGDNCSPISDTTILSSIATGTDLMDHVLTQLPLASVAAILAAVMYTAVSFFSM